MKIKEVVRVSGVAVASAIGTYVFTIGLFSAYKVDEPKEKKEMSIEFSVKPDETALYVIDQSKKKCKTDAGQKAGCFRVGGKKTGLVKYEFNKFDDDDDDDNDVDDGWRLKKFMICQRDVEITQANPCTTTLSVAERLEFFIMESETGGKILVTPASGEVDLSQLPAGADLREFYVYDQNIIKLKYVYSIEACNGAACVRLDPPVENKGRN